MRGPDGPCYERRMLFPDIVQSVGRTPMVELGHLDAGGARIFVKMESRNPCGSVKDRVGVALIEDAERRGVIKPGAKLVEPTSGNTGIALAFVAAAKGYALTLVMPERISQERVALLRMLGAEIVFTPGLADARGGGQGRGAGGGDARRGDAAAVQEPGEPGDPSPHDGRGDSGPISAARSTPSSRASAPAGRSPASARC